MSSPNLQLPKPELYSPQLESPTPTLNTTIRELNLEDPFPISKIIADKDIILKNCRQKYERVLKRHRQTYGVVGATGTNNFLRIHHITQAIKDAEEESFALLERLLALHSEETGAKNVDRIKTQFETFLQNERSRTLKTNTEQMGEYFNQVQNDMWNDFSDTLQSRFFRLFRAFATKKAEEKPFYIQKNMETFIGDEVQKCQKTCDNFTTLFTGTATYTPMAKSFEKFMTEVQSFGQQLLAKNKSNKDAAEAHLQKVLIEQQFMASCKVKLSKMFEENPFQTDETRVKAAIVDEEKTAIYALTNFIQLVCLEGSEAFSKQWNKALKENTTTLLQYSRDLVQEIIGQCDGAYQDLQKIIEQGVLDVSKARGLPVSIFSHLSQCLIQRVEIDKMRLPNGPLQPGKQLPQLPPPPSPQTTRLAPVSEPPREIPTIPSGTRGKRYLKEAHTNQRQYKESPHKKHRNNHHQ